MFIRIDGLFRILSSFENILYRSSFLSFQLDRDAMDYALSVVQFLRRPDLQLVHAGK